MRRWLWVAACLGVLAAHTAISSLFPVHSAAPDLLLVGTLVIGMLRGPVPGAASGLALGFAGDILAGRLIGLGALTIALSGAAAGLIARRVFRENLIAIAVTSFALGLAVTGAYGIGARWLGLSFSVGGALWAIGVPVGLYSALLVPLFYALAYQRLGLAADTQPTGTQRVKGGDAPAGHALRPTRR